ncbi:glycosyltransferase family 2 protein [Aliinostoc sp. HNIBRCY26]|uniref:glycosyltransferase family 2 protein n=1 Tax=Aliinostoc sp. HNIBRCY26 TaxID=3418997 RepID=UPI003D03A607
MPKKTPTVAVIIPLYNKGEYIARTLNSILNQTYQNLEIIVVNDGSTDNSADIVKNYQDSRIKLIHQTNAGPGAARNRGMSETQADFLSFLDADDEWLPDFLATSIHHLQTNPDCLLSVTGHFRGAERTNWQQHLPHLKINQGAWRLPTNTQPKVVKCAVDLLHSGAVVCARQVVEKFGGFYSQKRCTYGEDSYLWLQVLLNYKIHIDPTPLMWHHTEASVLGHGRKEAHPPWPKLTDTTTIRNNCPPEYQPLLENCLAYYALLAAERRVRAGDTLTAQKLLQSFPLTQRFVMKNFQVNCRLKLTQFLQLLPV